MGRMQVQLNRSFSGHALKVTIFIFFILPLMEARSCVMMNESTVEDTIISLEEIHEKISSCSCTQYCEKISF
jgi:hypothetical protein